MSYKLNHSAEAIDRKLSLIDENKNLLPYPYIDSETELPIEFPAGLEDVGDGSILVTGTVTSGTTLVLATCPLTVGKKYIVSLDFTNIVDTTFSEANPGFKLTAQAGTVIAENDINSNNAYAELDLTNEAGDDKNQVAALVSLAVPAVSDIGLVIKPQIEETQVSEDGSTQTTPTAWVPHMKTIGSYVDERFNGTNAKIKVLATRLDSLSNFGDSIQIGSTTLTEVQLQKILNFIDSIELEN